jgi:hypothetical protein
MYASGARSILDAGEESEIRVAFFCIEAEEIAPLFDAMFQCAREMVCNKTS